MMHHAVCCTLPALLPIPRVPLFPQHEEPLLVYALPAQLTVIRCYAYETQHVAYGELLGRRSVPACTIHTRSTLSRVWRRRVCTSLEISTCSPGMCAKLVGLAAACVRGWYCSHQAQDRSRRFLTAFSWCSRLLELVFEHQYHRLMPPEFV